MAEYRINVYPIEDEWAAEFPDIEGCFGGGKTPEEAVADARDNLVSYLATLTADGKNIPAPTNPYENDFSGKFTVRISKSLHKKLALMAENEGVSLNSLVAEALSEKTSQREIYRETLRKTSYMQAPLDMWEKTGNYEYRHRS